MYEIHVTTHCGDKTEYCVIDHAYMRLMFKQFTKCLDAHEIVVIDGLTGEVLWQWLDGEYLVANGAIL